MVGKTVGFKRRLKDIKREKKKMSYCEGRILISLEANVCGM